MDRSTLPRIRRGGSFNPRVLGSIPRRPTRLTCSVALCPATSGAAFEGCVFILCSKVAAWHQSRGSGRGLLTDTFQEM